MSCGLYDFNLMMNGGRLKGWAVDSGEDLSAVDHSLNALREKLGDKADCIKTVIKAGYRLEC